MKVPINWLENYIKLEHDYKKFGDIMTALEFMQDGPIEDVNGEPVIDLEVRQNRPDIFSIIGVAREYAAYINKPVEYPDQIEDIDVEWGQPSKNLSVTDKQVVQRFTAVEIDNIKVKKSPEWIRNYLEAYGIPAINNIVDITNYVMLEYGMPLHAFDKNKLAKPKSDESVLTLRKAEPEEKFETWIGTQLELTQKDTVVADAEKAVAIAGVIGGSNSGIDSKSKNIILESACYDQAAIRRSSMRHNLRTDSSTRHEKFLNPELVETAIRRAIRLILELAGGEVVSIEDFYEDKKEPISIDFNLFEIQRIGGVTMDDNTAIDLLTRLGFEIVEQKEAIGMDKNIVVVHVPHWRTDITIEADLVEEILRLWGYENIELTAISNTPDPYSTPVSLQLEDKISDILVSLGIDQHITNPLVEYNKNNKEQIKLENPLNSDKDGMRISIRDSLKNVISFNKKAGKNQVAAFEVGNVYFQKRVGEYEEQRRIETLYDGFGFTDVVKPDFMAILQKLGFEESVEWENQDVFLSYKYDGNHIADLYKDGYILYIDPLAKLVNLKSIPNIKFDTKITQQIKEDISVILPDKINLGSVANAIQQSSNYIKSVHITDQFKKDEIGEENTSTTFQMLFEDLDKKLTRPIVEDVKNNIIKKLKNKYSAKLG